GGVVYAACHDHHLYALDAATGQELWRHEVERRIERPPLLANCGEPARPGVLIADRGGTLTAVARPLGAAELEVAGRWAEAAEQWQDLGWFLKQAEALEKHAQSLESKAYSLEERADAWANAARAFAAEGEVERADDCQREVARWLSQPLITLDVEHEGLVLETWSKLE
ncbi:MAG: PQQ-binding-like beta-propeller repeat protein, partial [bacterium]|nr:PQQ-binding-like beta-propeller repeat protein [bacterium]